MPFSRKKEITARRRKIADLYLKGYTQEDISIKVGCSRPQVSNDLRKLHAIWLAESINDIEKLKMKELAKLDKLEQTYWEAWDKTITDFQQKSVKAKGKKGSEKPEYQEQSVKDMISMGNPLYLSGIERCIELRCKILGVNAPIKVASTDTSGNNVRPIGIIPVVIDSPEQAAFLNNEKTTVDNGS